MRCILCGAVCAAALALLSGRAEEPAKAARLTLTVSEADGIRRFGYPVSAVLPVGKEAVEANRFRLLRDGKPVAAQFRPHPGPGKDAAAVVVDFTADNAPFEKQTYTVEYGPDVAPGPEPKGGMTVETARGTITVAHANGPAFGIPDDLLGLFRQVRVGKTDYLREGSPGLWLRGKDESRRRVGGEGPDGAPSKATTTRSGPLATALRFEGAVALGDKSSAASVVEMEFPRSKSWVRVDWTVSDPDGLVSEMGAELQLNVPDGKTIVDFGAGSMVYVALNKGQAAQMKAGRGEDAGPAWQTLVGEPKALKPYVVAPPKSPTPAEGWAHVMDRERCIAVAVRDFAAAGQECAITVEDGGRLQIQRHFARGSDASPKGPKRLTFWLHFVSMPVQVGAKTSPQAMLSPLRVEVGR
jgi:hypothetical protein